MYRSLMVATKVDTPLRIEPLHKLTTKDVKVNPRKVRFALVNHK